MNAPRVALVVITDGREAYLRECLASLAENVTYPFVERIIVDDSADPAHLEVFADQLRGWIRIRHSRRQGGAAAIRTAWSTLAECDADYVFHVEQDFTFTDHVDIRQMCEVLQADPKLANLVLRRDPVRWWDGQGWAGEGEGGYIGDDPRAHVLHYKSNTPYLVHRKGFWLNPCVYPKAITELGWPAGKWPHHGSEGEFTAKALAAGYHFGVLGTHDDPPRCTHLGDRRSPGWT